MKKSFHEGQILTILQEVAAGKKVTEVCREHNICDATYYAWKSKYAGMTISEAQRLRSLEEENRKLKRIVADQAMDNMVLKDLLSKKWEAPQLGGKG